MVMAVSSLEDIGPDGGSTVAPVPAAQPVIASSPTPVSTTSTPSSGGLPTSQPSSSNSSQANLGTDLVSADMYSQLSPDQQQFFQRADQVNRAMWANANPNQTNLDFTSPDYLSFAKQNIASNWFNSLVSGSQADWDRLQPIKAQLSTLLKNDQFSDAFKFAQQNNAENLLENQFELQQLRPAFTKDETQQFVQAVPDSWWANSPSASGTVGKYNPDAAYTNSTSPNMWAGNTGYPVISSGFYSPATWEENLFQNAVVGGIAAGAGAGLLGATGLLGAGAADVGAADVASSGLGSALGAGAEDALASAASSAASTLGAGALSSAVPNVALGSSAGALAGVGAAAAKGAAVNAAMTALNGGSLGDILKSAVEGAGTAGITAVAAPELVSALSNAGFNPSESKAIANAVVSGGIAAAKGQDPVQSAVISGLGSYIGSQAKSFALGNPDVDPKIIGAMGSVAGSAAVAGALGQNVGSAALQSGLNQFYSSALGFAEDEFKKIFPDANIDSGTLKGLLSSSAGFTTTPSQDTGTDTSGALQEVTVTAPSSIDFSANPVVVGSTPSPQPSTGLPEVTVTAPSAPTPDNTVVVGAPDTGAQVATPTGGLETVNVTGTQQPPADNTVVVGDQTPDTSGGLQTVNITGTNAPPIDNTIVAGGEPVSDSSGALETVNVTGTNAPAPIDNTVVAGGDSVPSSSGALETVNVIGTNPPAPIDNTVVAGVTPSSGALPVTDEVTVSSTQPTTTLSNQDFNPITVPDLTPSTAPTVNLPAPPVKVSAPSGSSTAKTGMSGTSTTPTGIPWLDSAADFLKTSKTSHGSGLQPLQQLYSALDPSLAALLAQKLGTPSSSTTQESTPPPTGDLGMYGFASGGSTNPMSQMTAVMNQLTPNFIDSNPEYLNWMGQKPTHTSPIKKLPQMTSISPTWQSIQSTPYGGMARGGLPHAYKEAAPEGHEPEFITGLTGYYASGGGTGQSDDIPAMLHDGDHVADADVVAALGDGSSKAGKMVLDKFRESIPYKRGALGNPVPAKIADGEYVMPAAFVTALGKGDNKRGAKLLDIMREELRKHKRSAPDTKIPPKALSPMEYINRGLKNKGNK